MNSSFFMPDFKAWKSRAPRAFYAAAGLLILFCASIPASLVIPLVSRALIGLGPNDYVELRAGEPFAITRHGPLAGRPINMDQYHREVKWEAVGLATGGIGLVCGVSALAFLLYGIRSNVKPPPPR